MNNVSPSEPFLLLRRWKCVRVFIMYVNANKNAVVTLVLGAFGHLCIACVLCAAGLPRETFQMTVMLESDATRTKGNPRHQ